MKKVQIFEKFEEIIAAEGFLLIDVIMRGDNHLRIIEVYIDNEKGVTADDCSKVSRTINEVIEKESLISTKYRLDVSSPGVDRPLKYLAQYSKHINRKLEVEFMEGSEIKKIIGRLIKIESDNIIIQEKTNELKINYKDIIKAKVLISF
jgi:ribosome maturation factor RimP